MGIRAARPGPMFFQPDRDEEVEPDPGHIDLFFVINIVFGPYDRPSRLNNKNAKDVGVILIPVKADKTCPEEMREINKSMFRINKVKIYSLRDSGISK